MKRYIFPKVPPRDEYELTPLGQELLVPVKTLLEWVEGHWPEIQAARVEFDGRGE